MASLGAPAWGGSRAVAESAEYLAPKYGSRVVSRKRAANSDLSRSNPGSDHNEANRDAYALDLGTYNGAPLAHAIARHFGLTTYSTGNYGSYTVYRGGAVFRVQILWAVQGHYDHVHLGVKLVRGNYNSATANPLRALSKQGQKRARALLYHRREMAEEKRSGQGPRFRKHLKWARWYKFLLKASWRASRKGGAKRKTLESVLKATDGTL